MNCTVLFCLKKKFSECLLLQTGVLAPKGLNLDFSMLFNSLSNMFLSKNIPVCNLSAIKVNTLLSEVGVSHS